MAQSWPAGFVRTALLLSGLYVALFVLHDWDRSHLIFHAVGIGGFLVAVRFRHAPLARFVQATLLVALLAEILLRNRTGPAGAHAALEPVWTALATVYAATFLALAWRYRSADRAPNGG